MALPKDATYQRGTKDTSDTVSQEKPLAIGNKIWMHDPNKNKGLAWFMKDGGAEATPQHIFGHLEDVPNPNFVQYNGDDESTQAATGLVFITGANARIGEASRIFFKRINEVIRLNAAMASATTSGAVDRNFGRGVAATSLLKKGDIGIIMTPAWYQGFTTGDGTTNALIYKTFYTSEVSYPVKVTYVENAEESRAGKPFIRALRKSWKQAKDQMEVELYFSGYKSDTTSYAHPLTASEGLDNWITTNVYSVTKLSRMDFFDILVEWQAVAESDGAIHCSTFFKSMVTQWAMSSQTITTPVEGQAGENGKIGLSINRVKWVVGEFDLIDINLFNQEPNLLGQVFFIPNGHYKYRYLDFYENLDIAYHPISRDEVHADEGEIYGVYGHEFFEEERFAKLSGLNFAGGK